MKTTKELIDEVDISISNALKYIENSVGTSETMIKRKHQEIDKLYEVRERLVAIYNAEQRGGISITRLS